MDRPGIPFSNVSIMLLRKNVILENIINIMLNNGGKMNEVWYNSPEHELE